MTSSAQHFAEVAFGLAMVLLGAVNVFRGLSMEFSRARASTIDRGFYAVAALLVGIGVALLRLSFSS